jgi:hypothetical protein
MVIVSCAESPGDAFVSVIVQLGAVLVIEMPGVPQLPGLHVPPLQPPPPLPPRAVVVVTDVVVVPVVPVVAVVAVVAVVVVGGRRVVVVVPPPLPLDLVVVEPPLPPPPVFPLPPKPSFAGGTTFSGVGGTGGVTPLPLSGGSVGPVGVPVNVKLEILPAASANSGICGL